MAGALDAAHANALLDSSLTGTVKCKQIATVGTSTANGTEITPGGGYTAGGPTVPFAAAANEQKASNADVTIANMPAATINGVELWVGGARKWLTPAGTYTPKSTNAGDTLSYPSGSIVASFG